MGVLTRGGVKHVNVSCTSWTRNSQAPIDLIYDDGRSTKFPWNILSSSTSKTVTEGRTMSKAPKIAIIGGGPAGCSLARLLLKADIPVTIFEGEASPDVRGQGGTLDLHSATGLKVLKEAGLYEDFVKYARYDGEAFTLADKTLKRYISVGGASSTTSRGRPEIDRTRLRQILLESLPPENIRWGCRLRSIDEDLSLHFDHGVEREYDLIVGADGAWSKVRPLLSPAQPVYCGLGGMSLVISDVEKRYPDLHELVNRGSLFIFSDGKSIIAQQTGDGALQISAWSQRDEAWIRACGHDVRNAEEVKQATLHEYEGWAEPLLKLIQVADDDGLIARSLYELPQGHRWDPRPGVTLIGDAAHLATPFAGEGVNIAMEDALLLSRAIIAASKDAEPIQALPNRIEAFEEDMFRRGAAVQETSRANMLDMYFTPGAPATTVDRYVRRAIATGWVGALIPLWVVRLMLMGIAFFSR